MTFEIKNINLDDHQFVQEIITRLWQDTIIVVHNDIYDTTDLEGIKAVQDDCIVGFLQYQISGQECEILTLVSLKENQGIGSTLLAAVEAIAISKRCEKLSLITTNDNLQALAFYQRRGFRLTAIYPGQVEVSRRIKPSIPLIGENNIPLRDELKFEKFIY